MHRRKVIMTAAAAFAIGVVFAAQRTSLHADRLEAQVRQRAPWVPGANMLMSAQESSDVPLAPPR